MRSGGPQPHRGTAETRGDIRADGSRITRGVTRGKTRGLSSGVTGSGPGERTAARGKAAGLPHEAH